MQNTLKDDRLKFVDKQKRHSKEENEIKTNAFFIELMDIMIVDTITNGEAEDNKPNNEDQTTQF